MPEGPEVRFLREVAVKNTIGKTIKSIISNTKHKVQVPKESKIIDVGSKGKLLWLETNDYYVYIHFGLTGWILFEGSKYYKYIIKMNDLDMYIDDNRHLSKIHIMSDKSKHKKLMAKFGVDILTDDFTYDNFKSVLTSKKALIVAVLLDQENYSGIGNYIKNEALYMSHIDPHRKSNSLTSTETRSLYYNIKFVAYSNLIEMLDTAHIKIPKDINKLKPRKIQNPYKFRVYSNERDPKGNIITVENIGGRTTYYVKSLQK
jgi:DNA-formamidopyrimidine glycosylase